MKLSLSSLCRRTSAVLLVVTSLLATTIGLRAQDAVSNISEGTSGSTANIGISTESWRRAFNFTTGSSGSTFDFTSFTMNFKAGSGTPGALTVDLYSGFNSATVAGGTGLLANLSLTSGDPFSAGNAVFSGSATLNAASTYYLVLGALSTTGNNNYYTYGLAATGNETSTLPGWAIDEYAQESNSLNAWTKMSPTSLFSIQASASAVPEPSTYAAFAGLAVLGLAIWRRRRVTTGAIV